MWCTELRDGIISFNNYADLHPHGRLLIQNWFERARESFEINHGDGFEAFIFLWISFNGWATCVTGRNQDREIIDALAANPQIINDFNGIINNDTEFSDAANELYKMVPVFDPRELHRKRILNWPHEETRRQQVGRYIAGGAVKFNPPCWVEHRTNGPEMPKDWAHLIKAIYGIRCNLFHGQKSAFQELDRRLVNLAFTTLCRFISNTGYLNH
ncbi:MAG: hypothetical protein KF756_10455 [Acidobacteria bacterium]|nr:hypothetical protein [Acidobacteriota bacterium]